MTKEQAAEYRAMENIFLGTTGQKTHVLEAEHGLGYTSADRNIYIAWVHELYKKIQDGKVSVFRLGVFVHEMLHQIFTNFAATAKQVDRYSYQYEKAIFMTIMNLVEDAAIEGFAWQKVGGFLLDALEYTIAVIYTEDTDISGDTPMEEIINALIQFGDLGVVRGEFTQPLAKEYFMKIAPKFYEGTIEPVGAERVRISAEITEMLRPLWQDKQQEELERLMQQMQKALEKAGKSLANRQIHSEGEDGETRENEKSQARKLVAKAMSQAAGQSGEQKGGAESESGSGQTPAGKDSSGNSSGNGKSGNQSGNDSTQNGKDSAGAATQGDKSKDKEKSEDGNVSGNCDGDKKDGEASDANTNGKSGDESGKEGNKSEKEEEASEKEGEKAGEKSGDESGAGEKQTGEQAAEGDDGNNSVPYLIERAKAMSKHAQAEAEEKAAETLRAVQIGIQKAMAENAKSENEDRKAEVAPVNYPVKIPGALTDVRCTNRMAGQKASGASDYLQLYDQKMVNTLVNGMKRIFRGAQEETERRTSGKLNIKRCSSGTVSTRIFDRKRAPGNRADMAVGILVDNSGSMSGSKIQNAIQCCIVLTEALMKLDIPVYVMSFKAITGEVCHTHYVRWGCRNDRYRIAGMSAGGGNFDGYSVRYMTKLMMERHEEHKLLFVISDGLPSVCVSGITPAQDAKNAVRDAKKVLDVCGIALGNTDVKEIHELYGDNFVSVQEASQLTGTMVRKLTSIVKKW